MAIMNPEFIIFSILSLLLVLLACGTHANFDIEAIYQFGDSLSDTGNLIRESQRGEYANVAFPPYGITFFHYPTGRCSDGPIMIDYIAKFFNLPFLDPYLKKDGNFKHGVNFAVAGATALDAATLEAKNISTSSSITNNSLSVQISWFKSHLHSICSNSSDCKNKLKKSLFFMGEIGGNDVKDALVQGKSLQFLHNNMVPWIIQSIEHAVNEIIELGAIRIIVPGNFPIGCISADLGTFGTEDPTKYDELGCLKELNDLAEFFNHQLQEAIRGLQKKHPQTVIIYGDYFNALTGILRHAHVLGFDNKALLIACCGDEENKYHFNNSRRCGSEGTVLCPNPFVRVNWDGPHLTSHAYEIVAKFLLKDIVRGIFIAN